LFSGVGGFHIALRSLGGTCVLACDIDKACREVYEANYGIRPHDDVTKLDTADIPDFDVLCAGFPCQAFSHAGRQEGFADIRGTLFMDVVRILRDKKPRFFLLENVKNLTSHDGGNTWNVIHRHLTLAGYTTPSTPVVISPHEFGIPQHRERVYILGVRNDIAEVFPMKTFVKPEKKECSLYSVLDDTVEDSSLALTSLDIDVLNKWDEVVQYCKERNVKLPTFPIWSDAWDVPTPTDIPDWKRKFIEQNKTFYQTHQSFLESWLLQARQLPGFVGNKRKIEWQAGSFKPDDSVWTMIFQFRPSGIRMKRPTYAPALVAMAQIPVIGSLRRRMSPREIARLQSFPDTFQLAKSKNVCYKQFGNSVNVKVIQHVAIQLLYSLRTSESSLGHA
jgi:DNA (cytosine-5)-methyltransferase 1